jgi:hypothetical protein
MGLSGERFSVGAKAGTSGAVNLSKTPSIGGGGGAGGGLEQAVIASIPRAIAAGAHVEKSRVSISDISRGTVQRGCDIVKPDFGGGAVHFRGKLAGQNLLAPTGATASLGANLGQ